VAVSWYVQISTRDQSNLPSHITNDTRSNKEMYLDGTVQQINLNDMTKGYVNVKHTRNCKCFSKLEVQHNSDTLLTVCVP